MTDKIDENKPTAEYPRRHIIELRFFRQRIVISKVSAFGVAGDLTVMAGAYESPPLPLKVKE